MNETLPPLPYPAQSIHVHDSIGRSYELRGYTAKQMQAYARAAIQAIAPVPAVPERSLALNAALEYVGRHTPHLVYSEIAAALAAPQPAQQVAQPTIPAPP
jgi:hypothetical protein